MLTSDESYSRHNWYFGFLEALRDFCERGSHPKKSYLKLMDPQLSHEEFRGAFIYSSEIERETTMINYD